MKYGNILETIGNTPVIRIQNLAPGGVEMYVKVEAFNPMGSVKDRLALGIILDAAHGATTATESASASKNEPSTQTRPMLAILDDTNERAVFPSCPAAYLRHTVSSVC